MKWKRARGIGHNKLDKCSGQNKSGNNKQVSNSNNFYPNYESSAQNCAQFQNMSQSNIGNLSSYGEGDDMVDDYDDSEEDESDEENEDDDMDDDETIGLNEVAIKQQI